MTDATFEVVGGSGCPICTPLVGDRFTADELSSEMSAGAFHNGCQHGIEKVGGQGVDPASAALNRGDVSAIDAPTLDKLNHAISRWTDAGEIASYNLRYDRVEAKRILAEFADRAPKNAPPLYRGASWRKGSTTQTSVMADNMRVGDVISSPHTSWSSTTHIAENFADLADDTRGSLFLEMKPGARALNIEKLAGSFEGQREWVRGGRLRILNVTREGDVTRVLVEAVDD